MQSKNSSWKNWCHLSTVSALHPTQQGTVGGPPISSPNLRSCFSCSFGGYLDSQQVSWKGKKLTKWLVRAMNSKIITTLSKISFSFTKRPRYCWIFLPVFGRELSGGSLQECGSSFLSPSLHSLLPPLVVLLTPLPFLQSWKLTEGLKLAVIGLKSQYHKKSRKLGFTK